MKRAKWLLAMVAMVAAAPVAMGSALVTKGANEIAVSGNLDFATEQGMEIDVDARYAYFVMNRVALGAKAVMFNNDAVHAFGIGGTLEYNFAMPKSYKPMFGTDMVPYLGLAVDFRQSKLFDDKESAIVFGGEGGVKFFMTDTTAVTLSLVGELATEEIYADDLDATDKDLSLRLGMRFYF